MTEQTASERELAALIIETLNLEDTEPADIDPEEPLFGDGLGLDSIDALELALGINQAYGVQLRSEDENTREVFSTLRSLDQYIQANKTS